MKHADYKQIIKIQLKSKKTISPDYQLLARTEIKKSTDNEHVS